MSDPRFVGPIDRMLYLRTLPQVAGIPTRQVATMAGEAEEVVLRRGDRILREGERVDRFYVVVSGSVVLLSHGREIMHCRPGEDVGLVAALAEPDPHFEAYADEDTVALAIEIDVMIAAMEENFQFFQSSLRNLARFHLEIMKRIVGGTRRAPWTGAGLSLPDRPLDIVERLVLLRRGNIFRNLGLEALVVMATSMKEERWPAGTELWQPGAPADHLLVILDGEVDCRLPDGQSFEAGRGYPLGNIETLGRATRWYTPTTRTELVTLRGDHEALFDVLEDDFDVAMDFLSSVAEGALAGLERLAELKGPDAMPRLGDAESN